MKIKESWQKIQFTGMQNIFCIKHGVGISKIMYIKIIMIKCMMKINVIAIITR